MGIDEVLLQKYIKKKDETPIEGISIDGGRKVKLLIKKTSFRYAPNGFGVYSQMLPFDDERFEQQIASFMQCAHYTGIFEVELIVDDTGKQYFMEVNFRNTMFNHACANCGINILWLYAKWTLDNYINATDMTFDGSNPYVMYEFDDLKFSVLHGKHSLFGWLNDFRDTGSFLYIDKHDMKPFWALLLRKATSVVRRLLGLRKN